MAKSALTFLLALAPMLGLAQEAPTVFGLKFGEPVSLPFCDGAGKYQPKKGMCLSKKLKGMAKPYSGEARVLVACCEMPSWVAHSGFSVFLVDGRLEHAFIITTGVADQSAALAAMSSKFGKPASTSTTVVQNGYGAKFDAVEATWANAFVRVDFDGIVQGTSNGAVTIATPKGRDARADAALREAPARVRF